MIDELEALWEILQEDYYALINEGEECDGFETVARTEGDHRRWSTSVSVVTRGPSGQLYRWSYERGHTEYQENEPPRDRPIPVRAEEYTVTKTRYVKL